MEDKNIANKKSGLILENAKEQGAELLVTACPLCLYNLKKNTDGHELPVVYFTELLAQALGVKKGDE
jgi:heterodisulfide reductase subunit B